MGTGTPEANSILQLETKTFELTEGIVSGQGAKPRRRCEEQLSLFKRRSRRHQIELVERDLKVLDFILDMKFAGRQEVFERFFSTVHGGSVKSTSEEWTRKRLRQLVHSGFLRHEVGLQGGPGVYLATFKSYYALQAVDPSIERPKPTGGLDLRTFMHDRELLALRMDYERKHRDVAWISDRRLKQGLDAQYGIFGSDVPDALVMLPDLGRVALELEIAMKSRARYRAKIARFVRLIRESRTQSDGLRKVIYHCYRKPVFEVLKAETRIYSGLFEILDSKPIGQTKGSLT